MTSYVAVPPKKDWPQVSEANAVPTLPQPTARIDFSFEWKFSVSKLSFDNRTLFHSSESVLLLT